VKTNPPSGPQHGRLYSLVAFFSRLQLGYLLRSSRNPRPIVMLFVFTAGATALAIISAAAYVTKLPLLFPPLGPSAFILFYTPMSESASPRSMLLAHVLAVAAGLLALSIICWASPNAALADRMAMNWHRIGAIALAMGLAGVAMVTWHCVHPPAAATALIAAMGYLETGTQVAGLIGAVVLLILEAIFFNRIIGGLPYPFWRSDPKVAATYGTLAGIPESGMTFWQKLVNKTFQKR